jgi:hypothetical protein
MKRACRPGDGWYGIAKGIDGALDLVNKLRELEKKYQDSSRSKSRSGCNGAG